MNMGMRYGLPGWLTIVEPNIKAVRMESLGQGRPDFCNQLPYGHLYVNIEIEQADDVLSGNHQRMALRQGIPVIEGNDFVVLSPRTICLDVAERAHSCCRGFFSHIALAG